MAAVAIPALITAAATAGSMAYSSSQEKKQARGLQRLQQEQADQVAADRANLDQVAEGQRRVRRGGRGLLTFAEDGLGTTFGGAA